MLIFRIRLNNKERQIMRIISSSSDSSNDIETELNSLPHDKDAKKVKLLRILERLKQEEIDKIKSEEFYSVLQKILENSEENTEISFCNVNLNNQDVQLLATILADSLFVYSLDLSTQQIGDEGADFLTKMLKVNNTLTSLDLHNNRITSRGVIDLAEMLKEKNYITYLNLGNNEIREAGITYLIEMLAANTSIAYFDLSTDGIGRGGVTALEKMLKENNTLTYLRLSNNNKIIGSVEKNMRRVQNISEPTVKAKKSFSDTFNFNSQNIINRDVNTAILSALETNSTLLIAECPCDHENEIIEAKLAKNLESTKALAESGDASAQYRLSIYYAEQAKIMPYLTQAADDDHQQAAPCFAQIEPKPSTIITTEETPPSNITAFHPSEEPPKETTISEVTTEAFQESKKALAQLQQTQREQAAQVTELLSQAQENKLSKVQTEDLLEQLNSISKKETLTETELVDVKKMMNLYLNNELATRSDIGDLYLDGEDIDKVKAERNYIKQNTILQKYYADVEYIINSVFISARLADTTGLGRNELLTSESSTAAISGIGSTFSAAAEELPFGSLISNFVGLGAGASLDTKFVKYRSKLVSLLGESPKTDQQLSESLARILTLTLREDLERKISDKPSSAIETLSRQYSAVKHGIVGKRISSSQMRELSADAETDIQGLFYEVFSNDRKSMELSSLAKRDLILDYALSNREKRKISLTRSELNIEDSKKAVSSTETPRSMSFRIKNNKILPEDQQVKEEKLEGRKGLIAQLKVVLKPRESDYVIVDESAPIAADNPKIKKPEASAGELGFSRMVANKNDILAGLQNLKHVNKDNLKSEELLAACRGDKSELTLTQTRKLIEEGADVNYKDKDGRSLLDIVISRGDIILFNLLYDAAANITEHTDINNIQNYEISAILRRPVIEPPKAEVNPEVDPIAPEIQQLREELNQQKEIQQEQNAKFQEILEAQKQAACCAIQ